MQFELKPELRGGFHVSQRLKHGNESLGRGELVQAFLGSQPVSTRPALAEPDQSSPTLDRPKHLTGLSPVAVQQKHLRGGLVGGTREQVFNRFSAWMQDPKFPVGTGNGFPRGWLDPLIHMGPRTLKGAGHQLAGAGRAPVLTAMDQHIHRHSADYWTQRGAEAPAGRQATPIASDGSCEDYAAGHWGTGCRGGGKSGKRNRRTSEVEGRRCVQRRPRGQ